MFCSLKNSYVLLLRLLLRLCFRFAFCKQKTFYLTICFLTFQNQNDSLDPTDNIDLNYRSIKNQIRTLIGKKRWNKKTKQRKDSGRTRSKNILQILGRRAGVASQHSKQVCGDHLHSAHSNQIKALNHHYKPTRKYEDREDYSERELESTCDVNGDPQALVLLGFCRGGVQQWNEAAGAHPYI